ncbi:MAG: AAA family ATPase [Dongiaceae bacterium]
MRFRRLRLERFGLFTDRELQFDPAARLQLVYGPNEAGKSTALQAIGDLLFGIGVRSTYGFRHGYAGMRLAAEIEARDGSVAWFARRKGQRDTLRGPADEVLPEAALRRFLGPVDRALFESMFGLDCDRLRAGGEEMLQAKGEIGESLFQASAGLGGLMATIEEIEAEAAAIFGDRRGKRAFNEAREAYDRAQAALRQRRIRPEEWRELRRRCDETQAALLAAGARQRELALARARAERIRRVHPDIAALEAATAALAALGPVPALPEAAGAQRQQAIGDGARRRRAGAARRAARRGGGRLGGARRRQRAGGARRRDPRAGRAPRRRAEGRGRPAGAAQPGARRRPGRRRRGWRGSAAAAAGRRGRAAAGRSRQAPRAHLAPSGPASPRRRRRPSHSARPPPSASGSAARWPRRRPARPGAARRRDVPPRSGARAISRPRWRPPTARRGGPPAGSPRRWPPCPSGPGTRRRWPPPPCRRKRPSPAARVPGGRWPSSGGASPRRSRAARPSSARRRGAGRARHRERRRPTPAAIAAARQRRDAAWGLLRRRYEGGAAAGAAELAALGLAALGAGELDRLVAEADALADRRVSEADRVAAYEAAQQRQERQREELAVAADRLRRVAAEQEAAAEAWRALWRPAGIEPRPPEDMAEWLGRRREVLAALAAAEEAAAAREAAERRLAQAGEALDAAFAGLGRTPPEGRLSARLGAAERSFEQLAEAARRRRQLEERLVEQERALAESDAAARRAGAAMAAWQDAWAAAMTRLHLPPGSLPEEAETALSLWDAVAGRLAEERAARQRAQDMERDVTTLGADAARLADALAPELAADPLAAPPLLLQRLERALAVEEERRALAARLDRLRQASEAAAARMQAAEAALATLRALAGVEDDAALAAAIERAERRRALGSQMAALEGRVRAAGDGHAPEALAAECRGADLDALAAEVAAIDEELGRLQDRASELGAGLQRVEGELAALGAGRDAAAAAEEAESAVAEMREGAQRWLRLRAAALLLRRGLERYRQEQEGPLLHRAGEHFRLLTGGRYGELAVAIDERERALLVARSAPGGEKPVEAMSEGTRDQLYLALRLAAVEHHAEQAEPLPFIGDDLLVNFDDERAAAGLRLLAHLGETTQAILFTHHRHLVELAARTLPPGEIAIHDLGERAAA